MKGLLRLGDVMNAFQVELYQFEETEDGFFGSADKLSFPRGMWPRSLRIDNRIFIMTAYDGEGANYVCEHGDKPERVEVLND